VPSPQADEYPFVAFPEPPLTPRDFHQSPAEQPEDLHYILSDVLDVAFVWIGTHPLCTLFSFVFTNTFTGTEVHQDFKNYTVQSASVFDIALVPYYFIQACLIFLVVVILVQV
jgi:hypothetical protein